MQARGFTLVEVTIAIAIVAMLAGISIPVLDNVTRADLRAAASKTSGMVKATYDLAVLSGKPCRLVFDLKANTITAEMASERVTIADADMKTQEEEDDDRPMDRKSKLLAMAKRELGKAGSVRKTAQFSKAPGTVPYELPSGVHIAGVSAEHLRGEEKEGKVSLFFFPMGYCEHGLIHFEDQSERVFSVEVEPLTARTRITDKRVELKEDR